MKIKLINIFLLTTSFNTCFALTDTLLHDRAIVGFQGGLNFETTTTPSEVSSSARTGYTVGINLEVPLSTMVSLQPELNYSRRAINLATTGGAVANVKYHSLEHPAFLRVNLGQYIRPYIFLGPVATWNFSKELEIGDNSTSTSFSFNPKTLDISAVGGVGLQINSFFANARYSIGVMDISDTSAEWRSRGIKLLAGLQF